MIATLRNILYASLSLLALVTAGAVAGAWWQVKLTGEQVRSAISEGQWLIAEARPEVRTLLKESKLGVNQIRRAAVAFTDDLNSPEAMRARLATQRAGGSAAAFFERLNAESVPKLNRGLDASTALIAHTDASLNQELLPAAKNLLVSLQGTTEQLGADSRAVFNELVAMAKAGEVTMEAASRVLASSLWEEVLKQAARGASNAADFLGTLNPIAIEILNRLKTAAPWQKPLLVAQLIATLAHIIP